MTPEHLELLRRFSLDLIGGRPNRLPLAMTMVSQTQNDVADGSGLSRARVSQIVTGKGAAVTLVESRKLARHFGCEVPDLFPEERGEERLAS